MTEQLFILCGARYGSTLVRYLLDTHPAVYAPPELHLFRVVLNLRWVFASLDPRAADEIDGDYIAAINERIAGTVNGMLAPYLTAANKTIWCEKSVYSIEYVDLLAAVFPRARFLCLHRQCPDQVASGVEILNSDMRQQTWGFEPYLEGQAEPVVGLTEYWLATATALLACETRYPRRVMRLRYEDVVQDAGGVMASVCRFAGLKFEEGLVERVFNTPHLHGPGDPKIRHTSSIQSGSVNRRDGIRAEALGAEQAARVNELHRQLGYAPLD